MKPFSLAVLLFSLLLCGLSAAGYAEDVFRTGYACYDLEGNKRWTATAEIRRSGDRAGNIYELIEKGEGLTSGYKGRIKWESRLEFESTRDSVKPLKMTKNIFDEKGKLLAVESQEFDHASNSAVFSRRDTLDKDKKTRRFTFKGDIANRLILGLYIQKFLENGRSSDTLYMLSDEPRLYKVNIRIIDEESLSVNGSEKTAYRLCLDPELGLLNIAKALLPKAHVWHSAAPDFEWLKYRGLEGALSSPRVEIITLD